MPSNHLILCHPLLLLPSILPSIRIFSSESILHSRWPKDWSFSFNISSSNEYSGWFPLGWTGWISLQSKGLSRVFSNTTVQKHQFLALSFLYSSTLTSIYDHWENHSLVRTFFMLLPSHLWVTHPAVVGFDFIMMFPSCHLAVASSLSLDVRYLFLVGSSFLL